MPAQQIVRINTAVIWFMPLPFHPGSTYMHRHVEVGGFEVISHLTEALQVVLILALLEAVELNWFAACLKQDVLFGGQV